MDGLREKRTRGKIEAMDSLIEAELSHKVEDKRSGKSGSEL